MTEQTERKYVSDYDAIADLIENWGYDEPTPSWLEDAIGRYVVEKLEEAE